MPVIVFRRETETFQNTGDFAFVGIPIVAVVFAAQPVVDFVLSETLGFGAYMALNLVKEVPDLAVKGAAALFKETRRMNSAARFSTFGDASFQDTQQLATMRQSGMELAKMSQYRLEQTLMGNEAKYLHR